MALMEALDLMEQPFIAAAGNDLTAPDLAPLK
jgi:hypothetical protein